VSLLAFHVTRQWGWTAYTADNSGLAEGSITAIAFDDQGRAWIGIDHYVSGESLFRGSIFHLDSVTLGHFGPNYMDSFS